MAKGGKPGSRKKGEWKFFEYTLEELGLKPLIDDSSGDERQIEKVSDDDEPTRHSRNIK